MITFERKKQLRDNWFNETSEDETLEWRDDLNEEESRLVRAWDKQFSASLLRMIGKEVTVHA